MASAAPYPVRLQASLDTPLSRWLWLVKWLLAIPHYIVLAFLWVAFLVLSVVAFFAILITGRYPRGLFEFNVGVLRWSWRVAYYAYGALGTDRYPPFTLADVPDYPARLEVAYPQRLSRGLVLVKWWLLAIPHYIIVGFFLGGGTWAVSRYGDRQWGWGGGLIGILVLVSAVVLLVRGRYPRPLYEFILGLDRWVARVAAYAGLMTDEYPPFRLDMGGADPPAPEAGTVAGGPSGAQTAALSPGPAGAPAAAGETAPPAFPAEGTQPGTTAGSELVGAPAPGARRGWTGGRIAAVVVGSVLALLSAALLFGGGAALWADRTQRDGGLVTTGARTFSSGSYAIASDSIDLQLNGATGDVSAERLLGTVRIRATPTVRDRRAFLGIAPRAAADRYLQGVGYATVSNIGGGSVRYVEQSGGAPPGPPAAAGIWVASATGPGTAVLRWPARSGDWKVVLMNADGSPGVSARVDLGATVSWLKGLAIGLLVGGVLLLLAGVGLIALAVNRASAR